MRHLLTHTAGLNYGFKESPDGPYHRVQVSDGLEQPGLAIDENLRRLASVPLLYPPGKIWHYSLAIDVLGELVARVGHASLPKMIATIGYRAVRNERHDILSFRYDATSHRLC